MKINEIFGLKNIKSNINYIGIPIENFNKVKKFAKINEPKEPIIEFIKKKYLKILIEGIFHAEN